jgi:hypothetical protein
MALLEKAAGQGHAYAMLMLANFLFVKKEYERAAHWYTKGAETGLPKAMFALGSHLDPGEGRRDGMAAPDYPAAAIWYRRAADAGLGDAATNLAGMYTIGRGRVRPIMPPTSSLSGGGRDECALWTWEALSVGGEGAM